MKKILVPTDFSACSQNAVDVALETALRAKAGIHFLHILPAEDEHPHVSGPKAAAVHSTAKGKAQDELNKLVAKANGLGLSATPLLAFDKGNERIENYIAPLNIDLIVMGSHGATGIRELVIGSTTQRVVRHSTVPVFVIKNKIEDPFKIEQIIYASTFAADTIHDFDQVARFAQFWNATIDILFINFKDKEIDRATIDRIAKELTLPYPGTNYTAWLKILLIMRKFLYWSLLKNKQTIQKQYSTSGEHTVVWTAKVFKSN
jgi:nucleotide-binding universal stress UspA family protein